MPWSQTPVVSLMLAITYAGLLPSVQLTPSAFSHTSGIIPMTTTIHFSGLNTQPASLIHPASDSPLRAGPRTSLLIWWLTFNQVGLESLLILTHWVTLSNFIPPRGNPNDLSLSRHDHWFVIFLDKLEINSIIQLYYKLPLWFRPRARGHLGGPCFYEL